MDTGSASQFRPIFLGDEIIDAALRRGIGTPEAAARPAPPTDSEGEHDGGLAGTLSAALRAPMLTSALLLLLNPAFASPTMELVPRASGAGKTMATTVKTKGAEISTAAFVAAVMDCDHYPLGASVMGVKALQQCKTLEKRADGYTIVYQLTGGNMLVSSREYVIAMKVAEVTDTKARVEWDLVKHVGKPGTMTGPYASALNDHAEAVFTPYNTGGWTYDKTAGTIHYTVTSNAGGTVPDWLVSQDAVMAFPLELMRVKWGVKP